MSGHIGQSTAEQRKEYNRLWDARRPGETVLDVERRERALPPVPDGLCGNRGCVFTAGHPGPHTWHQSDVRRPTR